MGTAGGTAPLRRTGSLLGLLGLEGAAVLGLHWLGRFAGLRIGWDEPVSWLLNSPIQNVLGSILRMVSLVMAYWLLASTVAYLLASLTRVPGAVRAVGWATLPLVRRVADHAVAVTLATSMVGGTTLGVAGPALAAESRGYGPPAPKPVAAAQDGATTTEPGPTTTVAPVYTPDPADQAPSSGPEETTPPTEPATTEPEPTRTSKPAYIPNPADQAPSTTKAPATTEPATTEPATSEPTTTTAPTTATEPPTTAAPTTTAPTTTAPTTTAPTTTAPTTTAAPTTAAPTGTRRGSAAATTSTTGLREPSYQPTPGTPTPEPPPIESEPSGPNPSEEPPPPADKEESHTVAGGESLWTIAQDHLEAVSGGSEVPDNDEVTAYWAQVKEANQGRLESGDPDVIRTGEKVVLPPVASASGKPAPETRKKTSQPAVPGDSLWAIARDHLAATGKGSGEPSNRQVAEYWAKVKEANRHRLASRDPDLIEPGEIIVLPPVD